MYNKLLIFTVFIAFVACRTDSPQIINQDHTINVRLEKDPQRISPMFAGRSAHAREVFPYMFLQLLEFDPVTLQLSPILAKSIPVEEKIDSGRFDRGVQYTFEILEDAVWMDGTPITARDYIFTLKAVKHPNVNATSWKNILEDIVDVEVDPDNQKKFTVIFRIDNALAVETAGSFEIYPAHIYDPENALDMVQLIDYLDTVAMENVIEEPVFQNFAKQFNNALFQQDALEGAGPYRLKAWETDQYLSLVRKDNWWGNNYPERTFLQAIPREIVFHFIKDETTAITQLKSGAIDLMTVSSGTSFKQLQEEDAEILQFSTPQVSRFFYIAMNNRSPILGDPNVRKAMAHLMDVDNFIEVFEEGFGQRTTGTILPFDDHYAASLTPLAYDTEAALSLLADSGWKDSDDDGILDKQILGIKTDMKLRMHISGSPLGQRLALILKENAKPIGIEIDVIQKEYRNIVRENIYTGDYDMTPLALQVSLTDYDPYNRWHSDNAALGKDNVTGYMNEAVDEAIEMLESEGDPAKRKELYMTIQNEMYEDQPAIFLYSALTKLAARKELDPEFSVKRPGYFLQRATITTKEVAAQ